MLTQSARIEDAQCCLIRCLATNRIEHRVLRHACPSTAERLETRMATTTSQLSADAFIWLLRLLHARSRPAMLKCAPLRAPQCRPPPG
eukprot:6180886-Pleurochrysis_carterae.AAC.1